MSSGTTSVKETVKQILLDHTGSDNPITSREINDIIDVDNIGSFPGTRAVIREIMIEDRIPIAGSSQGYYVIESEDELADYIENLESRILRMTERQWAIKRAAREWDGDIELSDDEDLL